MEAWHSALSFLGKGNLAREWLGIDRRQAAELSYQAGDFVLFILFLMYFMYNTFILRFSPQYLQQHPPLLHFFPHNMPP